MQTCAYMQNHKSFGLTVLEIKPLKFEIPAIFMIDASVKYERNPKHASWGMLRNDYPSSCLWKLLLAPMQKNSYSHIDNKKYKKLNNAINI